MKVKTWFKRIQSAVTLDTHMTQGEYKKTQEGLDQLFELFRPYLEDDMIVAIKDLEHK